MNFLFLILYIDRDEEEKKSLFEKLQLNQEIRDFINDEFDPDNIRALLRYTWFNLKLMVFVVQ